MTSVTGATAAGVTLPRAQQQRAAGRVRARTRVALRRLLRRPRRQILWRFAAWYAVLAVGALLALALVTAAALEWEEERASRHRAGVESALLAQAAAPLFAAARPDLAALDALVRTAATETGARITLIAPDGTVLADSEAAAGTMENHAGRPEVAEALRAGRGQSLRPSATVHRRLLYAATAATSGGRVVGVVRVAAAPPSLLEAHAPVLLSVAILGAAIGGLSIALTVVIGRSAVRPIHQLTRAVQRLDGTGPGELVPVDRQDELGVLAAAFNAMALRLRQTDTVRREFVANVSHELRTPLASLKALVETLEEGALEDPPAARDFLAQMDVEVESLAQLVQELLDLSRIESGQAQLRLEAVAPARLAETAIKRLRRQAERSQIALEADAPASLPMVQGDPARIEQVLINLLHNAVKFTPAGGRVRVGAEVVPAGDAPHDVLRFCVADSGIGIPAADLPRVFERFYKGDRSRASVGTGLGLAIAKHLVQAHGGRIWAESAGADQGSTFCFTLPLASAASRTQRS
jgi:signal transduction histidine kinase